MASTRAVIIQTLEKMGLNPNEDKVTDNSVNLSQSQSNTFLNLLPDEYEGIEIDDGMMGVTVEVYPIIEPT